MAEVKNINGYTIKDETARNSITTLEERVKNIEDNIDLSTYATKTEVNELIGDIDAVLDSINGEVI